jgi:RimJ/RimL family protein N-acetyltransferase
MPVLYSGLAAVWVLAAAVRWLDDDSSGADRWAFSGVALASVGVAALWWRRRRQAMTTPAPAGLELLPIDESVLDRLVEAATSDAAPDEVTPPMAGDHWGPERIEWLRSFHRDRRPGLDGPLGEATWAVSLDGTVVGAVRLKRTDDPMALETGIWLTRGARGHGTGRLAVAAALRRARELGARVVRADTSPGNAAALYVLQRLGFRTSAAGDRVLAVRTLE